MKAVVLEIRGESAAVLRKDGVVDKISKGQLKVGDEIELKGEAETGTSAKILSIAGYRRYVAAAAAVLLFLTLGFVYSYFNVFASAYVSMDINPSLEFSLNRMDRVITAEALNEDAENIVRALKQSNIRNSTLSDAIDSTWKLLEQNNYIAEGKDNVILLNVSSDDSGRNERLMKEAENVLTNDINMNDVNMDNSSVNSIDNDLDSLNSEKGDAIEGGKEDFASEDNLSDISENGNEKGNGKGKYSRVIEGGGEGRFFRVTESSIEDREHARELGISTGKYNEIRGIRQKEIDTPEERYVPDKSDVERFADYSLKDYILQSANDSDEPKSELGNLDKPKSEPGNSDKSKTELGNVDKPKAEPGNSDKSKTELGNVDKPKADSGNSDKPMEIPDNPDKTEDSGNSINKDSERETIGDEAKDNSNKDSVMIDENSDNKPKGTPEDARNDDIRNESARNEDARNNDIRNDGVRNENVRNENSETPDIKPQGNGNMEGRQDAIPNERPRNDGASENTIQENNIAEREKQTGAFYPDENNVTGKDSDVSEQLIPDNGFMPGTGEASRNEQGQVQVPEQYTKENIVESTEGKVAEDAGDTPEDNTDGFGGKPQQGQFGLENEPGRSGNDMGTAAQDISNGTNGNKDKNDMETVTGSDYIPEQPADSPGYIPSQTAEGMDNGINSDQSKDNNQSEDIIGNEAGPESIGGEAPPVDSGSGLRTDKNDNIERQQGNNSYIDNNDFKESGSQEPPKSNGSNDNHRPSGGGDNGRRGGGR